MTPAGSGVPGLTGRISQPPNALVVDRFLSPQLDYDLEHLLSHYVTIERVLAGEYARMGVLSSAETASVISALAEVTPSSIRDLAASSMFDVSFALELHVRAVVPRPITEWHVDHSRNDVQACANLMHAREGLIDAALDVCDLADRLHALAREHVECPMPGFTHLQAGQVISLGFYITAITDLVLHGLTQMDATFEAVNRSPLGAGAMNGKELPWDLDEMSRRLGFSAPHRSALRACADRGWALDIGAVMSNLSVGLSRPLTDLMAWTSSQYAFASLPDDLGGISSAMPQKKNYPILERVRGRLSKVTSRFQLIAHGHHNTAFANSVELGKEIGVELTAQVADFRSAVQTLGAVCEALRPDCEALERECAKQFLGAYTLANRLTMREGLPWRTAQIVAGRCVVAMQGRDWKMEQDAALRLSEAALTEGFHLDDARSVLEDLVDPRAALWRLRTASSCHPDHVRATLADQLVETQTARGRWTARAGKHVDMLIGTPTGQPT